MARGIRNTDPSKIRLMTIRTHQAQLLMRPSDEVNDIIGGVVARYQEECGILIYGYSFQSNHYHMVVQAPDQNLSKFAELVNKEIAKRVNIHIGREGTFWGTRYKDQLILEPDDELECLLYVVCNPVRHGLVMHPTEWPGLNCYWHLLDGKDRKYAFINYTEFGKAKRKAKGSRKPVYLSDYKTWHTLHISPLPAFASMSQNERAAHLTLLIHERTIIIQSERKTEGKGFLGRKAVLAQSPFAYPETVKKSPQPLCYTKSWEAKKAFMVAHFPWVESYKEASRKFRSGDLLTEFPQFCYKPPLHHPVLST